MTYIFFALLAFYARYVLQIQGSKDFVEGFYIRFRDLSGSSQTYNIVTVLNGEALSYVLNDLKKFTKYKIFLVPFCRSVEGPPSNSRTVQTLEDGKGKLLLGAHERLTIVVC